MSREAMETLAAAEEQVRRMRADAAAAAKQSIADARESGEKLIAEAIKRSAEEIDALARQSDEKAKAEAMELAGNNENRKAVMRAKAESRAQQAVSLLDDHGTSVPKGTDLKNIVDIAVADFPTFQCFIRGKEMEHFNGIAFDIFRIHKEEGMKVTHGNLLAACKYYDSIHCGIRRTHIKLYTKNGQKSTLNQKSGQVGKKEEFDGMTSNDI